MKVLALNTLHLGKTGVLDHLGLIQVIPVIDPVPAQHLAQRTVQEIQMSCKIGRHFVRYTEAGMSRGPGYGFGLQTLALPLHNCFEPQFPHQENQDESTHLLGMLKG